jgi:hypothetical protein
MAGEQAYDLRGEWDLNYNDDPSSTDLTKHHQILNFVKDGDPFPDPGGPHSFRARFISRVHVDGKLAVTHAEVFTGWRPPTKVSPPFPLTVVAMYQGPATPPDYPYYSSWTGCLLVDWNTHADHYVDPKEFGGFFTGIERDQGRFRMKKRG